MINNFIANIIKYFHYLVIFYVFVGHSITPIKYLQYYLLLIILIFLDWNDYDGQCILTKLEHYFRFGNIKQKSVLEGGPQFFRPFVNNLFNLNLTPIEADRLNNFLFMFCFLIGFIRLLFYYQIIV